MHAYFFFFSDYNSIYSRLTKDWMLLEVKHRVSKTGSNEFWSLASKSFPKLIEAKEIEGTTGKIPQFRTIREQLHKENVPSIMLEVGYEVKATGDVLIMSDLDSIPVKKFPPSKYKKLYETAKVSVSTAAIALYYTILYYTGLYV